MPLFRKSMLVLLLLALVVGGGAFYGMQSQQEAVVLDAAAGREDGGLVNLNTADEKALDALPGVGPATARKIIEYRESEGGFQSTEDLMKIKGIGQAKYDKLKDKVTI